VTGLVLVGGGGHARSCVDVVLSEGRWEIEGIIERDGFDGTSSLGYKILGTDSDLNQLLFAGAPVLIAVGQITSAAPRKLLWERFLSFGSVFPQVQSPNSYVSPAASLGDGTVVMHGAVLNAGSHVGQQCIINTQATVEHDAVVEDFCHISTGALVNGGALVGEGSFIGSGAIVRDAVRIGREVVVGAGARVMTDLPDGAVFKGATA